MDRYNHTRLDLSVKCAFKTTSKVHFKTRRVLEYSCIDCVCISKRYCDDNTVAKAYARSDMVRENQKSCHTAA